ncbi:MAG: hypothetical protein KF760_26120 [Candidatus Eremiobacteraeota bacterium]|nr:hypothetical protein [Candidatus Eremiobacteraeota bacterium]MCW5869679.1 hypothetical protein [Candidatus Eremiobacteraeota bacterium]
MQVTNAPKFNIPRTLTAPKGQDQQPEAPKGPGFGDRFASEMDRTSEKVARVLTPLTVMFVGGSVGSLVGGMGLGTVGSLMGGGQLAMGMAQVGSMAGGLAGSFMGYRYGAGLADKPLNLIEKATGNSRAGRTALTSAYAAALGGVVTSLALGGINPQAMAIGAGVTLAGMGAWSAFQAK